MKYILFIYLYLEMFLDYYCYFRRNICRGVNYYGNAGVFYDGNIYYK